MKIFSKYDNNIVYDTEEKTICGSKIKNIWLSDGHKKYENTIMNQKKLTYRVHDDVWITPYVIYETEDGNFYDMNGARWDGLIKWIWS